MAKSPMKIEDVYIRLLEDVEGGYYPLRRLRDLNIEELAHFVTLLVKFTPKALGASSANIMSSHSWFNDLSLQRNLTSIKLEWRYNLKKIVLDCCNLFRDSKEKCLRLRNDDYCNFKRIKMVPESSPAVKEQKILYISLNRNDIAPESYKEHKCEEKVSNQLDFLSYFQLNSNTNSDRNSSHIAQRCSIKPLRKKLSTRIPFSSNIGQIILKSGTSDVQDDYVERKMDRVDRFLNQSIKSSRKNYNVSYVEPSKPQHAHEYKFPKRQYHQVLGNRNYSEFCLSICKPLKVAIRNEDLEQRRNNSKENTMPSKRVKLIRKKVASKAVSKRQARAALLSSMCTPLKIRIKNENLVEFKKRRDNCKTDGKLSNNVRTKSKPNLRNRSQKK